MNRIINASCLDAARYLPHSANLVIADPPFGLEETAFEGFYARPNKHLILPGYREFSKESYGAETLQWVLVAEKILRPGGALVAISGPTNTHHFTWALEHTRLVRRNSIVWHYSFE